MTIDVVDELHGVEVAAIIYDKKADRRLSVRGLLSVDCDDLYICYNPVFMFYSPIVSKNKPSDKLGLRYSFYLGSETVFVTERGRLKRFTKI